MTDQLSLAWKASPERVERELSLWLRKSNNFIELERRIKEAQEYATRAYNTAVEEGMSKAAANAFKMMELMDNALEELRNDRGGLHFTLALSLWPEAFVQLCHRIQKGERELAELEARAMGGALP